MKLAYARIFVRDLDLAVSFYGETLALKQLWRNDQDGHAGFDGEGCTLIVERITPEEDDEGASGRFTGFSFQVPNIEEVYRRLSNQGVRFTQPSRKMEWGGILAYFNDPEGNVIGLVGQ